MRSALIAGRATAALAAGILFDAGVASAHSPDYELSCEGATLSGEDYDEDDTNEAAIYIDGVVVFHVADFGTDFEHTVPIPQDGAVHSVRFVLDAQGEGTEDHPEYDLDATEQVGPCGEAPTTTEPAPTTSEPAPTTSDPAPTTSESPATSTTPPSSSTPPTSAPDGLSIAAFSPVCLRDAPYVDVTFGDQPQFNGRSATVTFIDLDDNEVETHNAAFRAGETIRFVYPGAEVDANGNPVDWPGWRFDGDEWVIDPTDARLRDGLRVVVEVNPTATGTVEYPPASPACNARPPGSSTTGGTLPATGSSNSTPTAMIASALLVGGAILVVIARLRTAKK
jgi:LPXTG-motif cell wall-anchored protein